MGKYKYFVKNVGLLAISQFGAKMLSFFLVPLYTNILTTEEYGTYDLFNTTVNLLLPILTVNIAESTLRFSIDKEIDRKGIFSISIKFVSIGSGIVVGLLLLNNFFHLIPIVNQYSIYFLLLFVVTALNGVVTYFARGIDKVADTSVSGIICSAVIIGLNILFLVSFKWGIIGYFLANILGLLAQTLYLIIRIKMWRFFDLKIIKKSLQKEMVSYSKPIIANSIAWWVNNASDRYIVTWLCGVAENGIYSVGYKIPSILNILQSIFNQAWILSAVKDFDSEDEGSFFTQMYYIYNIGMVCVCSVLIILTRFLAKILYAKDFYLAWKFVPFLLISVVFGALSGYLGGIFSAVKDSKIYAKSSAIGAVVNIILNIILVKVFGAIGAAIATAISYWIVWIIRVYQSKKYMNIKYNLRRDYFVYILLVLQTILLLLEESETILLYTGEIVLFSLIVFLFRKELNYITSFIRKIFNNKIKKS